MDILLKEGQYLSVMFEKKQGEVEIKWDDDTPIAGVFLDDDKSSSEADLFKFTSDVPEELQALVP